MTRLLLTTVWSALVVVLSSAAHAQPTISAQLLGTYRTGLADLAAELTSAQTVALRGDRMYGALVRDSGDQLELITAAMLPDSFHSDSAENNFASSPRSTVRPDSRCSSSPTRSPAG